MLLAEELLLLALDPEGGTPVNSSREPLRVGLSGALVAELGLAGLVAEDGKRLAPVGGPGTHPLLAEEPLLADVHRLLGTLRGRRAADQLRRLDRAVGGVWSRVVDALVDDGVLGRRRDRVLVVRVTRHPVLRPKVRDEVVGRMRAAAAGDDPLDARTATVLALSGPSRLLEVVAPQRGERRHARARIQDATEQTPIAPIVKKVISEAQAAAASAAAVAATSAASSG
ncbi:Golgi phosphoprotein 3 (GPP34) [Frankia canadensis]|uniref:Golgi phosphoprotein 3 (GPP34) n=1 Tax=Frankia canadensis TaxID=1836972 RepID=A0A2I2KKQ4_9ACTN|nr:GPP34 family phosphoprotein [Frankia canadensis]SNQ46249.1 Golgi phosphoprotein 3 (GPP34) [Frankia canadensis]SOU53539.1 Golgi phosphoprotein 3 (GPP34) [Frankia canadensis]